MRCVKLLVGVVTNLRLRHQRVYTQEALQKPCNFQNHIEKSSWIWWLKIKKLIREKYVSILVSQRFQQTLRRSRWITTVTFACDQPINYLYFYDLEIIQVVVLAQSLVSLKMERR